MFIRKKKERLKPQRVAPRVKYHLRKPMRMSNWPATAIVACVDCAKCFHRYISGRRCYHCSRRYKLELRLIDKLEVDIRALNIRKRLLEAKRVLRLRCGGLSRYKRAIDLITPNLEKPGWFQSVPELVAAIELVANKERIHHQSTIAGYKVDFVLPKRKLVLEIDGYHHEHKNQKNQQTFRDRKIIAALGDDWEVLRIKVDDFMANPTKLLTAIKIAMRRRKKLRATNAGLLPHGYAEPYK